MAGQTKGGKKGRKYDRSKRSLSGKTYKLASRWSSNKDRRIAKDKTIKARAAERLTQRLAARKPIRGAARALRRAGMQNTTYQSTT